MIKNLTAAFFVLLLTACSARQANDSDKERIVNLCEQFMQEFRDSKLISAMEILRNNSIISKQALDNLHQSIIEQEHIFRSYGKLLNYDFVEEKQVAHGLARRYYILRFENYYSIFQFTIYKTTNGWRFTHFKYDDSLEDLF